MKTIQQLLSKNKNLIIIFVFFSFLSLPHIVDICSGYLNYHSFDQQEFLLWNYSAVNGYTPYKNLFYPYGLLSFFRNSSLLFLIINYFIPPILLTSFFILFKKIFKDIYFLFFSQVVLYYFIAKIVGFDTFSRYGLFVVSSLIFVEILYLSKGQMLKLFTVGIFLGLLNFLIPDVGVYTSSTFLLLFLVNELIKSKKINFFSFKNLVQSLGKIKIVLLGLIIGSTPLIVFSLYHKNLLLFASYFNEVRDIALVAKTPFFSFVDSPSNIFTLLVLFTSIFSVLYRFFYLKHKVSLTVFFQIALIIDILILEQKSIVRSIDLQITFVSLILLMIIMYEFIHALPVNLLNKKIFYSLFTLLTVALLSLSVPNREINIKIISTFARRSITNKCYDSNLTKFLSQNSSYAKIIDLLKKRRDFNNKIFSFPTGDSTFYVLLNQKPPYYNAIFEGSSYGNQANTSKYIEDNKIRYITLNTNYLLIQDNVPDFIRQSYLFSYILNNYYPIALVDDYLILDKVENKDFFISEILSKVQNYRSYLLDVYLYKIPYSEGHYKYKNLIMTNKSLIESSDINKINSFLRNKEFNSKRKVIVLEPSSNYKTNDLSYLRLTTRDEFTTNIYYNSCNKNKKCLINLSNVPLFYKKRVIARIELNKEFTGKIKIYDITNPGKLW